MTNKSTIKGAYIEELLSTLTKIGGYRSTKINFLSNSSLFFTLTTIKQEGFYIVTLEHHFVLIEKQGGERYICDNGLKTPMKAEGSARLNQKVLQVYHIEKIGEHTYKKYTPPPAPILPYIPRVEGPSRLEIAMELLRKYKAGHDSIREEISEGEVEECKCEVCVRTRNFLSEKGD